MCIVSPPGSGKTRMGIVPALTVASWKRNQGRPGSVVAIAHREELIRQLRDDLAECGVQAGVIAPWERRTNHIVQVASIQTLVASGQLPPGDVVLWDECHHAVADSYIEVHNEFSRRGAFHIGLTATPERSDGTGLIQIYKTLIVAAQRRQLIKKGYLVPTEVLSPKRVLVDGVADVPVKLWERHARGTRTVVFARTVESARQIHGEFAARGWSTGYVDGEMDPKVRAAIIRRFIEGKILVMVNCRILTEGFNLPSIETVVLALPVGHASLYLQMVGRAGRTAPGKTKALCLDLVGNWKMHGLPDENRSFHLKGRAIGLDEKGKVMRRCRRCSRMWRTSVSKTCPYCQHSGGQRARRTRYLSEKLSKASKKTLDTARQSYFDYLCDHARNMGHDQSWIAQKFQRRFGVSCSGMRRTPK